MSDPTRAATLWKGGKRAEAEREILDVLRRSPDDLAALQFAGELYGASARKPEAAAIWRRAVAVAPHNAVILRQCANAVLAVQAIPEAIEYLRRALEIEPQNARALNNLGLAYLRAGDPPNALRALHQAVSVDPRYALGHMNLGLAQHAAGHTRDARASYEQALALDPHLTQARAQLSVLLSATDAAAARRERDRALESTAINYMTVRRHDLAIPLWTQLIDSGAQIDYLLGTRFHCELHCCDWTRYDESVRAIDASVRRGEPIDLPFSFFIHSNSGAAQLRCAENFVARRFPPRTRADAIGAAAGAAQSLGDERIKIAYLSFDFHEHATAYLIAGLLESHDRSRFEVTALSYGQDDGSAMRRRLEQAAERFVDISQMSDLEVGALIADLGIGILVDLKGFTGGARTGILALRPAPLQINFLGYPGTLGAPYIDYIVADRHVIPADSHSDFSERVITLPRCYQPNDDRRPRPVQAPSRAELKLPESGFVYCCFNNLYKITPVVFSAWMSMLAAVDASSLWLLEGSTAAMQNLREAAARHGIDPQRILFAPHIELAQHLARYRHADLFLDTLPCNAHTTASDALWMGVPVLTIRGDTFAGCVATSLLHAVELPSLSVTSLDTYRAEGIRLAQTPAAIAALKAHLESGRDRFALFDTRAHCRHLESAYLGIWDRYRRGEAPAALAIADSG